MGQNINGQWRNPRAIRRYRVHAYIWSGQVRQVLRTVDFVDMDQVVVGHPFVRINGGPHLYAVVNIKGTRNGSLHVVDISRITPGGFPSFKVVLRNFDDLDQAVMAAVLL